MKKMDNEPDDFTLRPRISINCMYITTRGDETRKSLCRLTRARGHSSTRQQWGVGWPFFFANWTWRRATLTTTSKNLPGSYFKNKQYDPLMHSLVLIHFTSVWERKIQNEPSHLVLAFAFASHTWPFCKWRQTGDVTLMRRLVGRQMWSPRLRQ